MFRSAKFNIVWSAVWLAWCVGFFIFDIFVGAWIFAVVMALLTVFYVWMLFNSIARYDDEKGYQQIDNEWRHK